MLGLSLWEGRLPGQKTIENEDKAAIGSYRPESNFGTSDTVRLKFWTVPQGLKIHGPWPSSGILDCLRGSPDRRPLEPGSMEWLIKRSLAKPCRV